LLPRKATNFLAELVVDVEKTVVLLRKQDRDGAALRLEFIRIVPHYGDAAAPLGLYARLPSKNPCLREPHASVALEVFKEDETDPLVAHMAPIFLAGLAASLTAHVRAAHPSPR
jgi:hypothetical protein